MNSTNKARNRWQYRCEGFTLLERLVVVAIISMLAMIILAAVNSARLRSVNTATRASLVNIRVQAELFYSSNGGSYMVVSGTVTDLCSPAAEKAPVRGIYEMLTEIQSEIGLKSPVNNNIAVAGAWNRSTCHAAPDGTKWVAEVPLKESTGGAPLFYCVDNTGRMAQESVPLAANTTFCS